MTTDLIKILEKPNSEIFLLTTPLKCNKKTLINLLKNLDNFDQA